MKKDRWTPLAQAAALRASPEVLAARAAETPDRLAHYEANTTYWVNDLYQVSRTIHDDGLIHLCIRRRDGRPIFRDWRHFQRIKNELVGPECEGVELYPAESRLTDTSNKFHIRCVPDPAFRFPFGFTERDVADVGGVSPGLRQRRFA